MKNLLLVFISFIVFLSPSFGQTVPSYVPTDGLVGYWPFNGNADDESGNGNDGTVNGVTLTTDRFGNENSAYSFDGSNDFIQLPNIIPIDKGSMSYWYKTNSSDENQVLVYHSSTIDDGFGTSDNAMESHTGIRNHGYNTMIFDNGYGVSANDSLVPVVVDTWYHIVVTFDKQDSAKMYIDGNLVTVMDLSTETGTYTPNTTYIGRPTMSTRYFDGVFDDIGIWNRALTEDEITDLYESTPTNTTDLQTNTLSIYPNPTQGNVTINLESPSKGILKAYDLQGRLIHSQPVQGESSLDYTIEGEAGLYLIEFVDERGEVYLGKVVKM